MMKKVTTEVLVMDIYFKDYIDGKNTILFRMGEIWESIEQEKKLFEEAKKYYDTKLKTKDNCHWDTPKVLKYWREINEEIIEERA